jgi:hypothetical protein
VVGSSSNRADAKSSLTRVALAHAAFKAAMHPDSSPDDAFFKTCEAEVNVINLFFPDIRADTLRLAFAAWLAFACAMDDILETLDVVDREATLVESIDLLGRGKLYREDTLARCFRA